MPERKVEIPVERKIRDRIRRAKKDLTYDQYLIKLMECNCQ